MSSKEISTKMRIVNNAMELFQKHGFQNVSVGRICESVQITRSAFYYHFKTKDEIFDYFLITPELYVAEQIIPSLKMEQYIKSYRSQFFMIFELFLLRVVELGPEIVGFVFKRNIDSNVHNIAPRDITMWNVYVDLIGKAQEMKEVSDRLDAEKTVEMIIHVVNGIGVAWCNKGGSFDYVQECKSAIENIL